MENPVIILGASGIGKVAQDIFNSRDIIVYCFLDDDKSLHNTEINEVSVLGSTSDDGFLKYIGKKCEAFVAIEERSDRADVVKMLNTRRKVMPVNAIHANADISESAILGYGNFINAGAVVNASATLGNHIIIHSLALVEYDAVISDFVQIGARATVGARVEVGEGALIGAGAIITSGVKIGKNASVAPGSLVMTDVEEETTVFGIPAKAI
ncbi:NeuD/PglB/VioB family sugar acetyltransferase [Flammeovirgaceae bacterium SG7u.111]|nr:NeuD/PglB/VioB family sugar acetyltransferase [Flammeovirgaceae bacterium SG7u.132]WPO34751.1 NeuD/PglB/VioB family sugar acetyltransferase [Flammeovirgaceae bacterium SG7u.111]